MTRRYVVIGAGAVGAALAAGLSDASIPVVLVSRGATAVAIRERGLVVAHGGVTRTLDVPVVTEPTDLALTADDILVFAVKTQDAATALAQWSSRPVSREDGSIGTAGADVVAVTLQNGLEADRLALRHFDRVIAGVTLIAAQHVVPGRVDVFNGPRWGQLILGAYPSASARPATAKVVDAIVTDLDAAQWLAQAVAAPSRWKAWKLTLAVTFGVGVVAGEVESLDLLRAEARAEATDVLRLAGYDIADPAAETSYDSTQAAVVPSPEFDATHLSPWQSFARGAGSEIDFLNGEIALLARQHGASAPVNTALQQLLGVAAARRDRPGTVTDHDVRVHVARHATAHPTIVHPHQQGAAA
ncbi:MAG: ketopantoate reductase family protein [Demequina sp.]|uniref:ketopantoate reductase family protein n=1 Tax=Demequina sp. TaxID=2050685 RepID=UPI003A888BBF